MAKRHALSVQFVRDALIYEPSTGKLFWKSRPDHHFATEKSAKTFRSRYSGKEAFTSDDGFGYRQGRLNNIALRAHVVAVALMTGKWPANEVDHINGKRHDNRWSNLRQVTRAENSKNTAMKSNNTSGFAGVIWHSQAQKWQARIGKKSLGMFSDIHEAAKAREDANAALGYSERHGKSA